MRGASLCPVKTQCGNGASVKPQPSSENEQNPPWGRKTWVLTLNPSMPGISRHKNRNVLAAQGHGGTPPDRAQPELHCTASAVFIPVRHIHSLCLCKSSQHGVNTAEHAIPAQCEHTWPCHPSTGWTHLTMLSHSGANTVNAWSTSAQILILAFDKVWWFSTYTRFSAFTETKWFNCGT